MICFILCFIFLAFIMWLFVTPENYIIIDTKMIHIFNYLKGDMFINFYHKKHKILKYTFFEIEDRPYQKDERIKKLFKEFKTDCKNKEDEQAK